MAYRFGRRIWLQLLALVMAMPTLAVAGAYEDFFLAVSLDNAGEVSDFLKRGFDPNSVEPVRGDTALIVTVHDNHRKVFDVLLGARNIDINARARNGNTALMVAAYKGNKEMAQALLAKGARVNQEGWAALHYAAASGSDEIVDLLLKKSAAVNAPSPNGTTALMMAARAGHIMMVKRLLDAGANLTQKNEQGLNAVDFARLGNHKDIVDGLTHRMNKAR